MIEFLANAAQALSIFAMLCGTYFAITYGRRPHAVRTARERFDPMTSHSWNVVGKGR